MVTVCEISQKPLNCRTFTYAAAKLWNDLLQYHLESVRIMMLLKLNSNHTFLNVHMRELLHQLLLILSLIYLANLCTCSKCFMHIGFCLCQLQCTMLIHCYVLPKYFLQLLWFFINDRKV